MKGSQDPEEAAKVVQKHENIMKTKEKFIQSVSGLGIHKTTIIFKIKFFKLCERYPKLFWSSIGLGFFKIIIRILKQSVGKMNRSFRNHLLSGRFYFSRLSL